MTKVFYLCVQIKTVIKGVVCVGNLIALPVRWRRLAKTQRRKAPVNVMYLYFFLYIIRVNL